MNELELHQQVIIAVVLDLLIGDPSGYPHPVRIIGAIAEKLEAWSRKLFANLTLAGTLTTTLIVAGTYWITIWLLEGLEHLNRDIGILVSILLIYTTLSIRSLFDESRKVIHDLKYGHEAQARMNLAMIVGRDTDGLERKEILRATVETISESIVDGIIAPLFYACIGGAPLALAYKSVNTLDSMFGYKNETYRYFGIFPARLDDAANWIPARLGGPIIALASLFCGLNGFKSLKAIIKYGQNHLSPNSGIPEAAVAGALGIQLGGTNFYGAKPVTKPFIGEKRKEIEIGDIEKSHNILFVTSGIALLIFTFLSGLFWK